MRDLISDRVAVKLKGLQVEILYSVDDYAGGAGWKEYDAKVEEALKLLREAEKLLREAGEQLGEVP